MAEFIIDAEHPFWKHVDIRGPDECWEWLRGRYTNNYGRYRAARKSYAAHRMAYMLAFNVELPFGQAPTKESTIIMHDCDNRVCCNPAHLTLGTPLANMLDMMAKGRHVPAPMRGEKNGNAILAEPDVLNVLKLKESGLTMRAIAEIYSVSKSCIMLIVTGRNWNQITGLPKRRPLE